MNLILIRNMDKLLPLFFLCLFQVTTAYYVLTDEERASLPALHHVDRFSKCVDKPGGIFCTAHASIYADGPHKLLKLIDDYKKAAHRHYNYSNIIYGYCVTERCQNFYQGNSTEQLTDAMNACLDHNLMKNYNLHANIRKMTCYQHKEEKYKTDSFDWIFLYVILAIVALNLAATVYDVAWDKKGEESIFLCFSMRANWDGLAAPGSSDPLRSKLTLLNGMKAITSMAVMLAHTPIGNLSSIENEKWLENTFEIKLMHILLQGHTITLTFFLISGFLLTYNIQVFSENHKLYWTDLPKGIFLRWFRLVPVNIFIIALTATWFRFTPVGPYWRDYVSVEVDDCRTRWLPNILYYSNYIDDSYCNVQGWSMAADMHLHIIGLGLILLSPTVKFRNRALWVFFLVGLVLPVLETYFRDLDATFLVVPEMVRDFFLSDPTFNYTYRRSHSNIPCFVIGMATGYLVYNWQRTGFQVPGKNKKWVTYLYWTLFPLMMTIPMVTFLWFLDDGPRAPMGQRLLYALIQKPLFGVLVALVIIGLVFDIESTPLYRRVLGWFIWTPLSKLAYSMFSIHVLVTRVIGGPSTTLTYMSLGTMAQEFSGIVIISVALSLFIYLLLEAPFGKMMKVIFFPSKLKEKVTEKTKEQLSSNGKSKYTNGKTTDKLLKAE